jgi:hypothetical protein
MGSKSQPGSEQVQHVGCALNTTKDQFLWVKQVGSVGYTSQWMSATPTLSMIVSAASLFIPLTPPRLNFLGSNTVLFSTSTFASINPRIHCALPSAVGATNVYLLPTHVTAVRE